MVRQKQARAYGRRADGSVAFAEGDGPPCDHGPECEVRYLFPFDGETNDEFVDRLTFTYSGRAPRPGGRLW